MSKVELSRLVKHINEYNKFLKETSGSAKDEVKDYVEHLHILNSEGKYEDFMMNKSGDKIMFGDDELTQKVKGEVKPATRYAHPVWWIAHAIHYNEMTLDRIEAGTFNHATQLSKIDRNANAKGKATYGGFKAKLVSAWQEYCFHKQLNYKLFETAQQKGVDYDN